MSSSTRILCEWNKFFLMHFQFVSQYFVEVSFIRSHFTLLFSKVVNPQCLAFRHNLVNDIHVSYCKTNVLKSVKKIDKAWKILQMPSLLGNVAAIYTESCRSIGRDLTIWWNNWSRRRWWLSYISPSTFATILKCSVANRFKLILKIWARETSFVGCYSKITTLAADLEVKVTTKSC